MIVCDRDGVRARYNVGLLAELESLVASCCNIEVPFNNCITGSAAFCHKAGIHTKAVLANPRTYEILRPEDFGVSRRVDYSSALSGWNAIMFRARSLGLDLAESDCKGVTELIKEKADGREIRSADVDRMLRHMGTKQVA